LERTAFAVPRAGAGFAAPAGNLDRVPHAAVRACTAVVRARGAGIGVI